MKEGIDDEANCSMVDTLTVLISFTGCKSMTEGFISSVIDVKQNLDQSDSDTNLIEAKIKIEIDDALNDEKSDIITNEIQFLRKGKDDEMLPPPEDMEGDMLPPLEELEDEILP
jgi:hypothetical protein